MPTQLHKNFYLSIAAQRSLLLPHTILNSYLTMKRCQTENLCSAETILAKKERRNSEILHKYEEYTKRRQNCRGVDGSLGLYSTIVEQNLTPIF